MWLVVPLLLTPRIEYRAYDDGCPSQAEFEAAVASRLLAPEIGGGRTFTVTLDADGGSVVENDAVRDLPRAADCVELAETAALTIAIAIDPHAAEAAGRADMAVPPAQALGLDTESVESWAAMVRDSFGDMGFELLATEASGEPCFGTRCARALGGKTKEVATLRIVRGFWRYRVIASLHDAGGRELYRYSENRWSWAGLERSAPSVAGSLVRRVPGRLPRVTVGVRAGYAFPIGGYVNDTVHGAVELPVTYEDAGWAVEASLGRHAERHETDVDTYVDRTFVDGTYLRYWRRDHEVSPYVGAGAGWTEFLLADDYGYGSRRKIVAGAKSVRLGERRRSWIRNVKNGV